MKKILILLIILSGCTKYIYETPQKTDRNVSVTLTDVNLGSAPNSGNGDPLRTAFTKVNNNNTLIESAFGNIYTETQTETLIADSLDALRDSALIGSDYFFLEADSNTYGGAITRSYLETYGGGGGTSTGGYEWTSFIVGTTTGAPSNTDTSFTIAGFAGDRIELYRATTAAMTLQWLNETATNLLTGYRYNSAGTIVVRPAWATGDRAYLRAVPSGYTNKISLTGTGGGSSLLTDLVAGWDLDELSGTRAFNVTDDISLDGILYNGVLVNQTGKFGVAYDFDGTNDYVSMGTDAYLRPQTFSISCWVNTTTAAAYKGIVANHIGRSGVAYGFALLLSPAGKAEFTVHYTGAVSNQVTSTTSINTGVWVNIICTFDGTDSHIYINDSASEDTDGTAGTIIYHAENQFRLGDKSDVDYPFDGKIDDVYIWDKVLSAGERTLLQSGAYPW